MSRKEQQQLIEKLRAEEAQLRAGEKIEDRLVKTHVISLCLLSMVMQFFVNGILKMNELDL